MISFIFNISFILCSSLLLSCAIQSVQCRTLDSVRDSESAISLFHRQDDAASTPSFTASPPSCPLCAQNYANINSCAAAAPVLANFTTVIFNPGAFIYVIKCACTDTFQSAYPQCVDCFTQTNQTAFLSASPSALPSIVTGIRNVCAVESTLLGNASAADGETTPSSAGSSDPTAVGSDTGLVPTSSAMRIRVFGGVWVYAAALSAGAALFAI
ncbi:hypothetical protein EW145_g3272 [Phellinidium pouzarii]|uniref:Uncharacterized protein n=1 Tax=Phellinidium pouzarii TaxID=167371 RepID=A0A4S4L7P0_9AGAM|nr:hypothetical protein EW145_g3272 [Phellinidium pouzarii]